MQRRQSKSGIGFLRRRREIFIHLNVGEFSLLGGRHCHCHGTARHATDRIGGETISIVFLYVTYFKGNSVVSIVLYRREAQDEDEDEIFSHFQLTVFSPSSFVNGFVGVIFYVSLALTLTYKPRSCLTRVSGCCNFN